MDGLFASTALGGGLEFTGMRATDRSFKNKHVPLSEEK